MSQYAGQPAEGLAGDFVVPGTCVSPAAKAVGRTKPSAGAIARDPVLRNLYLTTALAEVPRLLGAIDRNPYRPTYGCLDRQYWHYRTSCFPSQMYQEGVLPLALVYATELPGNRWFGDRRVRELAIAALRFTARSSHRDGSCDDYYPFERALGAAVFSLQAAAEAYRILQLHDPELLGWFRRRGDWLIRHDESGRLANHQALAALGLLRTGHLTGSQEYLDAAAARLERLLAWQSEEGWFEEYGGADPGYQTVSIDCLAKIRRLGATAGLSSSAGSMVGQANHGTRAQTARLGRPTVAPAALDRPLGSAVSFARLFLHPDGSYGGQYGSRGTYHFYPHGMELLAGDSAEAADLADGFLRGLAAGKQAAFRDDRMFAHRLGNLIEAYVDWSPTRPAPRATVGSPDHVAGAMAGSPNHAVTAAGQSGSVAPPGRYFPKARLLVRRTATTHTVISLAQGGVFKHFGRSAPGVTDAGLVVETADRRVAVSQMHDLGRSVELAAGEDPDHEAVAVSGPLCWNRWGTATPLSQAVFHTGMWSVGRWCRTLVRRALQRRLITGRRRCPIRLRRTFEMLPQRAGQDGPALRITDTVELADPRIRVRRMAFGTDHEAAYVAASGVYQEGVLQPWTDLAPYVDELNAKRRVTVVREF